MKQEILFLTLVAAAFIAAGEIEGDGLNIIGYICLAYIAFVLVANLMPKKQKPGVPSPGRNNEDEKRSSTNFNDMLAQIDLSSNSCEEGR